MKHSVFALGVVLLSLVLAWGCGKPEEPVKDKKPASAPHVLVFQCAEGKSFTAELDQKGDSALLTMNGHRIKLPHVPSGSGAKFSNGKTTFWMKGNEAFVEFEGRIIMKDCRIKK